MKGKELFKAYIGMPAKAQKYMLWAKYIKNKPIVYGWHVDPSISDPAQAVTYLADAVGKTPAAMGASVFSYGDWANAFFMPKPCMLNYDGTVAYYLDPNDYTKKADGTASDVANSSFNGNAMMEWPLIWYKFVAGTVDGEGYFYCSDKKVDDSYKCWCNINSNNEITEHFYTSIYNGTGTSKLRSLSGVKLISANGSSGISGATEISRALANNTSAHTEWYTDVWCDRQLIAALLVLIGKTTDSVRTFGLGRLGNTRDKKETYITGVLNNKGLFYGSLSDETIAVKVFGMENWWGTVGTRTAGLVSTSSGYAYKLTYGTADGTNSVGYNSTGNGYKTVSAPQSGGYITKMHFPEFGLPSEVVSYADGGNTSTYYCAFKHQHAAGYTVAGDGDLDNMYLSGCFRLFSQSYTYTDTYWGLATRLYCKPVI